MLVDWQRKQSHFFLSSDTQKLDACLCVIFILFENCHCRCSVFSIMARTEDKFSVWEKGFGICLIYELNKPLAQQTIFFIFFLFDLVADDVGCPVAPSADWIECQVRGALVDPPHDGASEGATWTRDKLTAWVGMGENSHVGTLGSPVGPYFHLQSAIQKCWQALPYKFKCTSACTKLKMAHKLIPNDDAIMNGMKMLCVGTNLLKNSKKF